MNTTFWGPSGWKFLHTLTFIYPENPSATDKTYMRNFMHDLPAILPCKYCRASFAKYAKSLPIEPFLANRATLIEWLYKMHNKVNKKLRAQGFCHYDNPPIDHVYKIYTPHQNTVEKIMHSQYTPPLPEQNIPPTQLAINYICNLGYDFLGSIVFNYQGYYSNCHTSNEKVKIVSVYDKFFNSIIPLICLYLDKDSKYTIPHFKIKQILSGNEPYTKLINWFYKCNKLANPEANTIEIYKSNAQTKYEEHFRKHIANTCNTPKGDAIKSCRKYLRNYKTKKTMKRK